ncbi:glycosyltransferase [Leptolyngbya sp. FACHB-671]|uniref:glycosyltransferase family 2 protein n=1 Tax=Leptolyngbya sp. FACHB-671 TaxID=2692812 RepID=UPI0016867864|nr:glycosyltransferase family A protein [Leptolyngbya sp. FACHB-671]MBD2069386.1 glycosyltransferase [Leptolyngbya sp. FACHB-671]
MAYSTTSDNPASNSNLHLMIVEAYEGVAELYADEPEEIKAARGLGLPVAEIAEQLDCRITVLSWDQWRNYEVRKLWTPTPSTRPSTPPDFSHVQVDFQSERVKQVSLPAIDPDYGLPFEECGLSPRSHGLINDSGLLFFASYCLLRELKILHQQDPFQAVILPMWGGVGYVSQMARATHAPNQLDVPFGVVVTDPSLTRQRANQEGEWLRHAVIRRQMEDLSLALADLTLAFGLRGKETAIAGRLPEASLPVLAPRFVEASCLDAIAYAANHPAQSYQSLQFFLYEPQEAASGVLNTLDAVAQLNRQELRLEQPVISSGPEMTFAPMKPREFTHYWSSRGFVRELVRDRQWQWQRDYPQITQGFRVRLYPSNFEYLPNVWAELARCSFVVLSPAAAEGLAAGTALPQEVLIQGEPNPETLANHLQWIAQADLQQLDQIRQNLCRQVVEAHRGEGRQRLLDETATSLGQLLASPPPPQDLSGVALLLGDRRFPLQTLAQQNQPPSLPESNSHIQPGTLSVVVPCYEMGAMLKEAIESIWKSERCPDEVLIIDDGSQGEETITTIRELEAIASSKGLPLRVIRKRNGGLAAARNTGLAAATGEFISFLDGDDLIEPQFYSLAQHLLQQYPLLGGVAAWASIFGTGIPDGFWNSPQPELPFLLIENSVFIPCLTRTVLLRQLGGYDTRQRYNYEDWELSVRMLAAGWMIVTIPMQLMKYRIRQDSLYRSMTDVQNQVMRELFLTTHQDVVSKFAVAIAMQLEHQWKQLAYAEPPSNSPVLTQVSNLYTALASTPIPKYLAVIQRFVSRFKRT